MACRLLDMGFEKDISRVVLALDERGCQRQTVLLSATLTAGHSQLYCELLNLRPTVTIDVCSPKPVVG